MPLPRILKRSNPLGRTWWAMVAAGAVVLGAGVVSNTGWAKRSAEQVAGLLQAS